MARSCSTAYYPDVFLLGRRAGSSFALVAVALLALVSGPRLGHSIFASAEEARNDTAAATGSSSGGERDTHDAAWAHSEQAYGRFWDFVAERKLVRAGVRVTVLWVSTTRWRLMGRQEACGGGLGCWRPP